MSKRTTKETKDLLKRRIKEATEYSRKLRQEEKEAGAADDRERLSRIHYERVHDHRSTSRHRLLAYAFLRGKTYEQVEPYTREGNKPESCYLADHLHDWEELDDFLVVPEWLEERNKTRFELAEEQTKEEAAEDPPGPQEQVGIIGRILQAVGL